DAADVTRLGWGGVDERPSGVGNRGADARATACAGGKSAAYLRDSGQRRDLDFILGHVNDLEDVCRLEGPEVVVLQEEDDERAAGGGAAGPAGGGRRRAGTRRPPRSPRRRTTARPRAAPPPARRVGSAR